MKKMFIYLALFVVVGHAQEAPRLSIDDSWTLNLPYLEIETINGKKAYSATLISDDGGITFVVDTASVKEIAIYEKKPLAKEKEIIWNKAEIIQGENPDIFRQDVCGARIEKDKYGCRQSLYGWEIDHIQPKAEGGSDDLSNLQPLYWKLNANKSDKLDWKCGINSN
ncbi:HNH endonuclease [Candidatus Halobeggiatoa sp. HSG11]|nr:HNH endonuclease [Candidatus Halobeggiatoa sp. HSG11]